MHVTRRGFSAAALLLPAVLRQATAHAAVTSTDGTAVIPLANVDATISPGTDPMLLVRDELTGRWTTLGVISAERGAWICELVSFDTSDAGWRQRVALVLPDLEHPDSLIAEISASEIARAPYPTLDVAKSRIDPECVEAWLTDPKLALRHAPYTLLLGFAGGPAQAVRLDARIEAAQAARSDTNLAAMLTADLELRGPARVDWIETTYFADHGRSLLEIEAALLALGVHGDADGTVPRARAIQAYRFFMRQHPPMAAFVATKFTEWRYWDAAQEYAALLESNVKMDSASQYAVRAYLQDAVGAQAAVQ